MTKNKKMKKINQISKIIFCIFLFLSIITIGILFYLKILPIQYFSVILIGYIIILLLFAYGLLNKKVKSNKKIIFNIICIIFVICFIFILYYLNSTMQFMDKIKSKGYQIETYYLIGHNSNQNIKTVGVYKTDNLEEALKQIDGFSIQEYSNIKTMTNLFIKNQIDGLFVNEGTLEILKEEQNFDYQIIKTVSIKIKTKVDSNDVDVTKQSFSIYISGIDVKGSISSVSRSDVNMIMTVNPKTNKILLTSIPRDYYVQLHGTTGYKDKLTHAGLYGINMSIQTIEDLLNMNINYYIRVNFTTLIDVVDAIGGITIYSDKAFTAYTDRSCSFKVGNNTVDGKCALAFSRERYAYQEGDRHRVKNQQTVLIAMIQKLTSSKTLLTKYNQILNTLSDSFETNISSNRIYSLINKQLDSMPNWNIETFSLDGSNSFNYTYSYSASKLYVMEPDTSTIEQAKIKIKEVGEVL